jgi:hypothetical protein
MKKDKKRVMCVKKKCGFVKENWRGIKKRRHRNDAPLSSEGINRINDDTYLFDKSHKGYRRGSRLIRG